MFTTYDQENKGKLDSKDILENLKKRFPKLSDEAIS